jgi:hypothetical protein
MIDSGKSGARGLLRLRLGKRAGRIRFTGKAFGVEMAGGLGLIAPEDLLLGKDVRAGMRRLEAVRGGCV